MYTALWKALEVRRQTYSASAPYLDASYSWPSKRVLPISGRSPGLGRFCLSKREVLLAFPGNSQVAQALYFDTSITVTSSRRPLTCFPILRNPSAPDTLQIRCETILAQEKGDFNVDGNRITFFVGRRKVIKKSGNRQAYCLFPDLPCISFVINFLRQDTYPWCLYGRMIPFLSHLSRPCSTPQTKELSYPGFPPGPLTPNRSSVWHPYHDRQRHSPPGHSQ